MSSRNNAWRQENDVKRVTISINGFYLSLCRYTMVFKPL